MKAFLRNTIILIALIVLDQVLKFFIESKKFFVDLGIVSFHYITNTGASFGIFQNNNVLLAWVSIIVLGLIMLLADKMKKQHALPVVLIVAGIIGNLIDRVFRGFVVDFIDFKFWPVFNIADSVICIGVIWLAIVIIIDDIKDSKKKENKPIKLKAKKHKKKKVRPSPIESNYNP
ncbi:MAG: signal peptidase II [Nanoarchaeota archaeon]|nr:signal peptidase II [Nanoarchaeota archaeon]MBU1321772.1 signal peptidase II [Nanoarchaeota archaeon]MBU1598471.1 signal peptidase II [Nanoarchaeota archaeon]MBU2442307.1 signal peptidase II [Nanoarchaeota archaeon]